jgi:hypothetical protein
MRQTITSLLLLSVVTMVGCTAAATPDEPVATQSTAASTGYWPLTDDLQTAFHANLRFKAGTQVAKDEGLILLPGASGTCRYNPLWNDGEGGGMGWHFTSIPRILELGIVGDTLPTLDITRPNVIIYNDEEEGGVRLAAIEWILPILVNGTLYTGTTPPPLPAIPPSLFGQTMNLRGPLSPGQDRNGFWNYQLHVWIYNHNPDGLFQQWNTKAKCFGYPPP